MRLTHEMLERARTQPLGEGNQGRIALSRVFEQVCRSLRHRVLAYQPMALPPRTAGALAVLMLWLGACGDKTLEQRKAEERAAFDKQYAHLDEGARPLTESEKIEKLIEAVRESGHTFIRNGQEHGSSEAADHLSMKLEKAGDRVRTAEEFIAGIASRSSMTGKPYMLRTGDGTEYRTRDWLLSHLRELNKPPVLANTAGPPSSDGAKQPGPHIQVNIDIEYALSLIEESELSFHSVKDGERNATYTSGEFARMLRRKSSWIGSDIEDLDPWLDEIASRSFKSDEAYLVTVTEGRDLELRPWLDEKLAAARAEHGAAQE